MSAAATSHETLLDVEAWGALDEDVGGELVDGVLVEEEMPSFVHETVVGWLYVLLRGYFHARGGFVAPSGIKLAIAPRRGRLADVVAFGAGKKPEPRGVVRVPPDIVVEVVSPTPADVRRDRIEKPDDYAALGVRSCWLVDPELRAIEVWELGTDRRYVRARAATAGTIDVPGFEGLLVDLDALWREVDRLIEG